MSVYTRILLWFFGSLVLAFLGFSYLSARGYENGAGMVGRLNEIDDSAFTIALEAYHIGGPELLRRELRHVSHVLAADVSLVDSQGVNLANGKAFPRSYLQGTFPVPQIVNGQRVFARPYRDGKYYLLMLIRDADNDDLNFAPFYFILIAVLSVLSWMLAITIAKPLRHVTATMERFGAGDLNARVNSTRKDEIGKLSRAFDRTADRIATLMNAERRLLQDVSHELRSPLSRLSFATELVTSAKDRDAAVEKVKRETRRLADLVSSLMEVTRAEGDPAARAAETVDLRLLLTTVVEDCEPEARSRGCSLSLKTCDASVVGDRELLRRAVENVVSNATRYAPAGTSVEVSCDVSEGLTRVWVRDYGPGAPDEDLTRIFQPFYRVDASREAATGGVGLGLAIAARAVALHHGSIWARNADPGLIVCIELPLPSV